MPGEDFDVCVVGTGAGGSVMIKELTAAGFRVVALERGPHLHTSQFTDDELAVMWRDTLFSPDQLETYRLDASAPTETGCSPPRFDSTIGGELSAIWGQAGSAPSTRRLSPCSSSPSASVAADGGGLQSGPLQEQ